MITETMAQWCERIMRYSKEANPYKLNKVPQPQEHIYGIPTNGVQRMNVIFKCIGAIVREGYNSIRGTYG